MSGSCSVSESGKKLIANCSETEAHEWLELFHIEWDRVCVDWMTERKYHYAHGWQTVRKDGIHRYFMKGDCDVAYYTPMMQTLHINAVPRRWAPESLMRTRNVYLYGQENN